MAGILAGFLSDKKTGGTDAGNLFVDQQYQDRNNQAARDAIYNATNYQGSKDALDPLQSSRTAANEVQTGALTSGLFGKGGTMDRTNASEQDLASRGFSLQPEDYEAYGQGAGNIAREFGGVENSMSEALANRGMSNSGAANQQFMGAEGNKAEMLGQLQMQIANQRMQSNMARLGQTRQFLGQLGQQAQSAQQNQYGRQMGSEQQNFNETLGKAGAGMGFLGAAQGQNNEQMQQRQQSQEMPGWASGLSNLSNMGANVLTSWATMGQGKDNPQSAAAPKKGTMAGGPGDAGSSSSGSMKT